MLKTSITTLLLITFFFSCKKNNTGACEETMSSIAGRYKISKFELVSYNTGQSQDVTSTLTACQLSGVFNLRADGTVSYTESADCKNNGSGTWSVSDHTISASFDSGNNVLIEASHIVSWDCTSLVVITLFPSVANNNRYTLTRF